MQLGRQGLDGGVLVTGKPAPGYIGQIVASGLTWEKINTINIKNCNSTISIA